MNEPKKILLTNHQSLGDITTLTAVPRDLHRRWPGEFEVGVSTGFGELWLGNPHCQFMNVGPQAQVDGWQKIQMRYPAINSSNRLPHHFVESWGIYLSKVIGREIPITEFKGDIYMLPEEVENYPVLDNGGEPVKYWLMLAGGKQDYSAKWWPRAYWQDLVWRFQDAFGERVKVVQIGAMGHFHPDLDGTINQVGQTSVRQLVQLVFHAQGTIGPNSFLNHMSRAVPVKSEPFKLPVTEHPGNPENLKQGPPHRPNVCISGGREPESWWSYNGSQNLSNVGTMDCCAAGGCWRSRANLMLDGDAKDSLHTCLHPVDMQNVRYAECMSRIKPEKVWDAIWSYYANKALETPR